MWYTRWDLTLAMPSTAAITAFGDCSTYWVKVGVVGGVGVGVVGRVGEIYTR